MVAEPILQTKLPDPPWLDPAQWRLPGMQPLALSEWLIRDEVFAEQMAYRDRLIVSRANDVFALLPEAREAAAECYNTVLEALKTDPHYAIRPGTVTRPDGVTITLDPGQPMRTLGHLVQCDLCLMQPGPEGHILTGAILCFPGYWTLAEKLGKPLTRIHKPVPEYDAMIARRVQRLFDAMRPEQPLWRANANLHTDCELYAPKSEPVPERRADTSTGRFVRSERQVLRKLPVTGAIVFSIHTRIVAQESLPAEARNALSKLQS